MKKTLVALAAVVAATGAMADSTVTGYFQLGINNLKTTTSGTAATKTTLEDTNANTALNFTDVEDLGDGLKVTTVIGLLPSTGSATAAGQTTNIALSGGFGELKAGKFGNDQFWTVVAGDATGYMGTNAAVVNLAFGTSGATEVWTSDQVRYQLPTFVPGLTLAYTNKLGGQTAGTLGAETVTGSYTAGAFNTQLTATQYKAAASTTDTLTSIAASYDFGAAKLYALSTSAKISGEGTVTGKNIGVSVPFGAFTLMYNNSSADGNLYLRNITAVDQTQQDLGVTYAFSKRTTAWVLFTKYSGATGGQGTNTESGTVSSNSGFDSLRVMLTHSF